MTVYVFLIGRTVMGVYSTQALAEMEQRRFRTGSVFPIRIDRPA